jgi:dephospho-CoA kinase
VVGMTGSGKSEVARILQGHGFSKVRFGDITDEEVKKRGLPLNEVSERQVRQELRQQHGMAAYAILNGPRIDDCLHEGNVVLDGLYSWEEYLVLKGRYGSQFYLAAVWSSPATRYARLAHRRVRPLGAEEAAGRDRAEIENSAKGGPIAMADFTLVNEGSLQELQAQVEKMLKELK